MSTSLLEIPSTKKYQLLQEEKSVRSKSPSQSRAIKSSSLKVSGTDKYQITQEETIKFSKSLPQSIHISRSFFALTSTEKYQKNQRKIFKLSKFLPMGSRITRSYVKISSTENYQINQVTTTKQSESPPQSIKIQGISSAISSTETLAKFQEKTRKLSNVPTQSIDISIISLGMPSHEIYQLSQEKTRLLSTSQSQSIIKLRSSYNISSLEKHQIYQEKTSVLLISAPQISIVPTSLFKEASTEKYQIPQEEKSQLILIKLQSHSGKIKISSIGTLIPETNQITQDETTEASVSPPQSITVRRRSFAIPSTQTYPITQEETRKLSKAPQSSKMPVYQLRQEGTKKELTSPLQSLRISRSSTNSSSTENDQTTKKKTRTLSKSSLQVSTKPTNVFKVASTEKYQIPQGEKRELTKPPPQSITIRSRSFEISSTETYPIHRSGSIKSLIIPRSSVVISSTEKYIKSQQEKIKRSSTIPSSSCIDCTEKYQITEKETIKVSESPPSKIPTSSFAILRLEKIKLSKSPLKSSTISSGSCIECTKKYQITKEKTRKLLKSLILSGKSSSSKTASSEIYHLRQEKTSKLSCSSKQSIPIPSNSFAIPSTQTFQKPQEDISKLAKPAPQSGIKKSSSIEISKTEKSQKTQKESRKISISSPQTSTMSTSLLKIPSTEKYQIPQVENSLLRKPLLQYSTIKILSRETYQITQEETIKPSDPQSINIPSSSFELSITEKYEKAQHEKNKLSISTLQSSIISSSSSVECTEIYQVTQEKARKPSKTPTISGKISSCSFIAPDTKKYNLYNSPTKSIPITSSSLEILTSVTQVEKEELFKSTSLSSRISFSLKFSSTVIRKLSEGSHFKICSTEKYHQPQQEKVRPSKSLLQTSTISSSSCIECTEKNQTSKIKKSISLSGSRTLSSKIPKSSFKITGTEIYQQSQEETSKLTKSPLQLFTISSSWIALSSTQKYQTPQEEKRQLTIPTTQSSTTKRSSIKLLSAENHQTNQWETTERSEFLPQSIIIPRGAISSAETYPIQIQKLFKILSSSLKIPSAKMYQLSQEETRNLSKSASQSIPISRNTIKISSFGLSSKEKYKITQEGTPKLSESSFQSITVSASSFENSCTEKLHSTESSKISSLEIKISKPISIDINANLYKQTEQISAPLGKSSLKQQTVSKLQNFNYNEHKHTNIVKRAISDQNVSSKHQKHKIDITQQSRSISTHSGRSSNTMNLQSSKKTKSIGGKTINSSKTNINKTRITRFFSRNVLSKELSISTELTKGALCMCTCVIDPDEDICSCNCTITKRTLLKNMEKAIKGDGISTRLLKNVRKENQTKAGHNGKKVATYNLISHVSKTFRFPYKTLKYKNETPKIDLKEQISPKLNFNKNVLIMTYKELLGTSKNALMLSNDEKSKGLIQENYIFNKQLFLTTDEFLSTTNVQVIHLYFKHGICNNYLFIAF
ncbi:uncharacterized protein LOC128265198 isoform X1 [Drosophila gunungcola]|uniref:uncharacterized protein LOC128265198 isoform X1 n=1 Tax=Drosophila gunungcola TaxID=103775 RepID=UPI0022E5878A|nr:uncharacterized protein LOC128265198 isoform X1 [Drosophila gunungcola]